MKIKYLIISIIIIVVLVSCGLFETRTPEEPDYNSTTYIPPTTKDILISNFIQAIKEKNLVNYIACFSDSSQVGAKSYVFIPSSSVVFSKSIFTNWNIDSEKQTFNTLIKNMPETYPELSFSNTKYDNQQADSVNFIGDYYLLVNHIESSKPKEYAGTMQLTLYKKTNGLWAISQWIDLNSSVNDTIKYSWSHLKEYFY